MKATRLVTQFLMILWPIVAGAEGVLFVDTYPEVVGIEVRPFSSVKISGLKTLLTDRSGQTEIIDTKRIAGTITFFDEKEYPNIVDESQLDPLHRRKSDIDSAGAKLIEAKPYARKAVATIDAVIARFRSGDRKVKETWLSAQEYRKYQSDLATEQAAAREVMNRRAAEQETKARLAAADHAYIEKEKQADNKFPSESADKWLANPSERKEAVTRFKDRVDTVLSKAMLDQALTKPITVLNDVEALSPSVTTEIEETVRAARSFRRSVGYDVALQECADDTAAVDTLAVIDHVLREIKATTPALALGRIAAFAKIYPKGQSERLQTAYKQLVVLQALCLRLQEESRIHIGRAKVLAGSGQMSEAIAEYEQALQVFPDPEISQQLKEARRKTLGL